LFLNAGERKKKEAQMTKDKIFLYEVDKEKKIATLTFNKPDKLNAFSLKEMEGLTKLLQKAQQDDNVKVLILKGAGRAFGIGDDLSNFLYEMGFTAKDGKPIYTRPSQRARLLADNISFGPTGFLQALTYFCKATIAQVHGYCYGGHLGIAIACDITIAADDTIFGHPGYRYMGPSAEGLHLPFILNIGVKRMMELMLTGRPFTAEEAEQIGLINKAVPLSKLEDEVQRYADTIALLSLDGMVVGKFVTRLALDRLGYGGVGATIAHTLGTNVKWDPGDFNMFKEIRDKGMKEAIKEREARYATLGMDIKTVRKKSQKR
jgi:enoyl-CoA hydratase